MNDRKHENNKKVTIEEAIASLKDLQGDHSSPREEGYEALVLLRSTLEKKARGEVVDLNTRTSFRYDSGKMYDPSSWEKEGTLLEVAVTYHRPTVIDYLIQNNAKADESLVHIAIQHGRNRDLIEATIKILLKNKININEKNKDGHTALYVAKKAQYDEAATILKKYNCHLTNQETCSYGLFKTKEVAKEAGKLAVMIPVALTISALGIPMGC